ncbi:MAG: FkbM family methyltransferase [Hydrogenophilales bacterium RIFOXYD1_FULL_62_11]|nr:MAG: FkbM family methyltransferase [Hydrogenophilales bacterium RIFOXYD1_FULL_62_11]
MLRSAKQSIKKFLNAMGIEAHRFQPETSPLARLMAALHAFNIDLVIDIGANDGQFAKELRAGGYSGRIVSFEPLTMAHCQLLQASNNDSAWQVHSRCAVGERLGEIELNISGNSVSSSILPMLTTHSNAAPESTYLGTETAPLTTVDEAVLPYFEGAKAPFLKIDTQGYEWHVLDGALATLPKVRGIQMELSLVPLYEGQRLWKECIDRLEAEGFVLWSLQPVFVDPANGRTLQWDGLFFRP